MTDPAECACGEPQTPQHPKQCVLTRLDQAAARGLDAVPADAARACSCGAGTLVPVRDKPADLHLDADGSAMVTLRCTSTACHIQSAHYWCWDQ